jgi:hypothetical protein
MPIASTALARTHCVGCHAEGAAARFPRHHRGPMCGLGHQQADHAAGHAEGHRHDADYPVHGEDQGQQQRRAQEGNGEMRQLAGKCAADGFDCLQCGAREHVGPARPLGGAEHGGNCEALRDVA